MNQLITKRDNGHDRVQTVNDEPSMTVQSDHHRSEIKEILRSYDQTGVFKLGQAHMTFRDVSEFEDYADMMLQSREAEAAFMRLPSKLREVFNHDHYEWLDAAHAEELSPELRATLEEFGYIKAEEQPVVTTHQNRTPDGQFASGEHSHPPTEDHSHDQQ